MIRNETIDIILERRTVRDYTDEKLTGEEIETILECAKWAASARNMQPCVVRCVQDKAFLDEMNTAFKDLVGWDTPAYTNWDKNPFYQNAPCMFFIYAPHNAAMDGGIMTGNIVTAAKSMGLDTCIIGSIGALLNDEQGKKWKAMLNIPESYKFVISIAAGHGAEKPAKKPRNDENFTFIKTGD